LLDAVVDRATEDATACVITDVGDGDKHGVRRIGALRVR
jgi:hypothetical protein